MIASTRTLQHKPEGEMQRGGQERGVGLTQETRSLPPLHKQGHGGVPARRNLVNGDHAWREEGGGKDMKDTELPIEVWCATDECMFLFGVGVYTVENSFWPCPAKHAQSRKARTVRALRGTWMRYLSLCRLIVGGRNV